MGLQDNRSRDFPAPDGGDQFVKVGYLPDVGELVQKAPHMDGQPAAVHIVRLVAQKIEQLALQHGNDEVEGGVRIAHNEEQRRFSVAQGVQLQFVVRHDLPQLRNIEGGKSGAAANQDGFQGLARDELSRTFCETLILNYLPQLAPKKL